MSAVDPYFDTEIQGTVIHKTDEWIVSVHPMIFNDRVILTHVEEYPLMNTAAWCFPKGAAATLAAMMWDVEDEWEPKGYIKVAYDGRQR